MRRIPFVFALAAAVLVAQNAAAGEKIRPVMPSILAKVGSDPVTTSELRTFLVLSGDTAVLDVLEKGGAMSDEVKAAMVRTIDYLVNRKILLAMIWRKKSELEDGVSRVVGEQVKLPGTPAEAGDFANSKHGRMFVREIEEKQEKAYGNRATYLNALKKYGSTLAQARTKLAIDRLIQLYFSFVEDVDQFVPPREIREYYIEHESEFKNRVKIKLRRIIISRLRPEEDAKKRVGEALERLKKGEDFEKVAKDLSDAPGRDAGGVEEWDDASDAGEKLYKAVRGMKKGELSGPVKNRLGYNIIMKEKQEPLPDVSFDEAAEKIKDKIIRKRRYSTYEELIKKGKEELTITDFRKIFHSPGK